MFNEKEKEEIRKQAKDILENFGKALDKVKVKEKRLKREVGGFREEGAGQKADNAFKEQMFANAPNIDGDFIVAEKKKWL